MATTTPNFGWPVPTSTDLVKDGATAIESLGDSIDASLLDLKGGTSGQVLSKNSNTDMDFTWVTSDDANAIQNAIVDAKGDLIAATAADTPARLAVGTNGQYLTADSTASTGLKWITPAAPASGLVYVTGATFTSVSSFDLPTDTFTTTYRNYQIFIDFTAGGGAIQIRVRKAGTTYSSGIYEYGNVNINRGGTVVGVGGNADTSWKLGYSTGNSRGANVITVYDPKNSGQKITVTGSVGTGDGVNGQAGGMWQGTVSGIDSLNFSIASGTMNGAYRVYGLADA